MPFFLVYNILWIKKEATCCTLILKGATLRVVETQPALTFCLASGWEALRAVKVGVTDVNLPKPRDPLLWRRGESERTQGTVGGLPVAGTNVSPHTTPHQGDGEEISTISPREGPKKKWTLGAQAVNIVRSQVQNLCLSPHVTLWIPLGKMLTFTCLICRMGKRVIVPVLSTIWGW